MHEDEGYSISEEEEEGEGGDEDGSSDDEGDEMLSTMSLSDSITDYVYENGRRYHSYRQGSYVFPNDELEQDRLDLMHHLWRLVLGGELFSAPIDQEKTKKILDVGTGTGIWAIDVADLIPSAEIIGNDLSPIQPAYVPPNLHFEIDDCEGDWLFPDNHFDFIHIRNLVGSIRDWKRIYEQAFRTLKPGGWIELKDNARPFDCDNGSLAPENVLRNWVDNFEKAAAMVGIKWSTAAGAFRQGITDTGFVNVTEDVHKVPLGAWAKGKGERMEEMGVFQREMLVTGAEGLTLAMFTRVLGWDKKEVDAYVASIKEALKDPSIRTYTRFFITYGQKPWPQSEDGGSKGKGKAKN